MADVTNVNQDNQNSEGSPEANSSSAAKLPLRGLAMVLIAVAVLLALWGLYAMTRDDSTDTSSGLAEEADVISTTPDSTAPGDTPEGTEPAQTPTPVDTDNSDDTDDPDDREDADSPEGTRDTEGADDTGSAADHAASKTGAAQAAKPAATEDKAPTRLNVLNNSTVPNLAAEVASTLKDDGYDVGEVGNLATQILPENTVYFQPGNKDAEQRAREMADKVDGVAREYDSQLPAETDGLNDITLVLVRQVAL